MSTTDEKPKFHGSFKNVQIKCETKTNPDGTHEVDYWVAWLPKSRFAAYGTYSFSAPVGWTYEAHELTVDVGPDVKYPKWTRIQGPTQRSVIQALRSIACDVFGESSEVSPSSLKATFVRHLTINVRTDPDVTSTATGETVCPLFPDDDEW